jgi:hypothetical protein
VTHYEVLGVSPDASEEDLRRAYLRLARRFHPDRHVGGDARAAADAEARMRRINAAWQVLGSATSRAEYDRSLRPPGAPVPGPSGAVPSPTAPSPTIRTPSSEFRPYFEQDEDDDDAWRYEPDEGDPATAPPRTLLIAPPVLLALSVVLLVAGLTLDAPAVIATSLIGALFSLLLFVGAPMVTLLRSRSAEERAARRR